jgi:general secretion pathway protein G
MNATESLRHRRRRDRGMTLIEIMIVLAIIALVMGLLVGPSIIRHFHDAERQTAHAMTRQIEAGYARWRLSNQAECPAALTDLNEELGRHAHQGLDDPWGHPYVMKCGDSLPPGCDRSFCVYSLGADGKDGSDDDVKSWEDPKPRR